MTIDSIPDAELLRRAVTTARSRQKCDGEKHCRLLAVMDAFLLGSSYAYQLCRRFGLDPDEMVKR